MTTMKTDKLPPVTIHMDGSDTVTLKCADYNSLLKAIAQKDEEIEKLAANHIELWNDRAERLIQLEQKLAIVINLLEKGIKCVYPSDFQAWELIVKKEISKIKKDRRIGRSRKRI